jgi:hypothetical protein
MAYTNEEIQSGSAIQDLLFAVRRSVRYNNRRRGFYDFWNTFSNALAVLFGSATIGGIIAKIWVEATLVAAALVTVVSTLNLVWGTSRMARLHGDLVRRFMDLESEIVTTIGRGAHISPETVFQLVAKRLAIESDEPPVKIVLNTMCQNEVLRAQGFGKDHFIHVSWYQRIAAQFFDIREHSLRHKPTAPQH